MDYRLLANDLTNSPGRDNFEKQELSTAFRDEILSGGMLPNRTASAMMCLTKQPKPPRPRAAEAKRGLI